MAGPRSHSVLASPLAALPVAFEALPEPAVAEAGDGAEVEVVGRGAEVGGHAALAAVSGRRQKARFGRVLVGVGHTGGVPEPVGSQAVELEACAQQLPLHTLALARPAVPGDIRTLGRCHCHCQNIPLPHPSDRSSPPGRKGEGRDQQGPDSSHDCGHPHAPQAGSRER